MARLTTIQTGIAGEYFVAAELTRRGFVASLTLRNTRGIDILVSNQDATHSLGIQVKTKRGAKPEWILNRKAEEDLAAQLFYVFVMFQDLEMPRYYVVPRKIVAGFVKSSHQSYLRKPGRDGRPHKDSDMRKFEDPTNQWLDRWDLLERELGKGTIQA